jgi:hypothetical protein
MFLVQLNVDRITYRGGTNWRSNRPIGAITSIWKGKLRSRYVQLASEIKDLRSASDSGSMNTVQVERKAQEACLFTKQVSIGLEDLGIATCTGGEIEGIRNVKFVEYSLSCRHSGLYHDNQHCRSITVRLSP